MSAPFNGGGAQAIGINCADPSPNPGINASGEIYGGYSDIRLKDNIRPINGAGDIIYNLHGLYYKYNQLARQYGFVDDRIKIGLLAQELEKVFPMAVKKIARPDGSSYLGVNYELLIPVLVECIKEQQIEIDNYLREIEKNG